MKTKKILPFLFAAVLLLASCSGTPSEKADDAGQSAVKGNAGDAKPAGDSAKSVTSTNPDKTPKTSGAKVLVYYFHASHRCATCIAIEKAIDEVLAESFSVEVKTGTLKLEKINADDEANNAICEKYEAFGTALFVTRVRGNEETKTDMTAEAFKLARNKKDEFKKLLGKQISTSLN